MPEVPMLADRMVGKLARMLRMIGQDVEYVREGVPLEIARRAQAEGRVLLTRDTKLAARTDIGPVLLLKSNYPFHQARQVIRELGLPAEGDARFRRCTEDNGLLERADRDDVRAEIPPYIAATHEEFHRCARCRRVYWAGTHLAGMQDVITALEDAPLVPGDAEEGSAAEAALSLEPLVDLHHALDVLLLEHRLALMRGDLARSLRTIRRFGIWLRRHMQDEAELVLPIYAAATPEGGFERGAAPELFHADHEKLLAHVERIEAAALELTRSRTEGDELRVACLALLDREKVLVDLLEHHDRRERAYLYPVLDRVLSDGDKATLIERMVGLSEEETRHGRDDDDQLPR